MKKVLILVIAIISISFTACSSKEIPQFNKVETEEVYVFSTGQEFLSNYTEGYYHDVVKGDNLNNLAKKYLNNRERWGEFLRENTYLSNEADYRHKPHPTLKVWKIFPGERIFLPNDAVNAKSLGRNNSIQFILGDATHEEFIRDIPTERNMDKLYVGAPSDTGSVTPKSKSNWDLDWSFLNWFIPFLLVALLAGLFFIWLFKSLTNRNQINRTSVTESITANPCTGNCKDHCTECCDDCTHHKIMAENLIKSSEKGNYSEGELKNGNLSVTYKIGNPNQTNS